MGELVVFIAIYIMAGFVVAFIYHLLWKGKFHWRHVVMWPILNSFLFWAATPPAWLKPSRYQVNVENYLKRIQQQ